MPVRQNEIENQIDVRKKTTWNVFQDFLNDFFGCFFPGIFFCLFFSLTVLSTLFSIYVIRGYNEPKVPNYILEFIGSSSTEFTIFFVVFSFILGSIFYRKDPKHPDKISAKYIWKKSKDKDELAVQMKDGKLVVEYPYHFIYEYLNKRGLDYIAKHIPWKGSDPKSYNGRSKMFINILKIRINYYAPFQNSDIIKNEAHIRLISSLWHATIWILWISFISLLLTLIFALSHKFDYNNYILFLSVCWIFVQIGLSAAILLSIRKFFHYQRVREIVYVLETASNISKRYPEIFQFK